jgi:anaerobic selenocysteine-containing dehydrogenase
MGQFQTMPWEEAIERIAAAIVETESLWGSGARGCIMSADVAMEDAYVAGKLWKAVLRSPNTDSVESMHSRATERAFLEHLGEIAPPTCIDDVNLANLIVVVGEDIANTHPVLYARVAEAVVERGAHLTVIDPRMTATALRTRSDHIPVQAGGEVALLNAIGYVLVHEKGVAPDAWAKENVLNAVSFAEFLKLYNPSYDPNERVDADYLKDLCNGPSDWVDTLGNRDASGYLKSFNVAAVTGISPANVRDLADRWALSRNVLAIWSSRIGGAGDSGAAVSSLMNLLLLTSNVGRPGAGPLGIHANALGRGAFDMGGTPMVLPGGHLGGTEAPPASLEETWGADYAYEASRLPTAKGAVEMLAKAKVGGMPFLLLLGGSVSAQMPDTDHLVDEALRSAFVVSTAAHLDDPDVTYADLVLPRLSWYEREAHFISAERKVARSLPSMAARDGTWPEWMVLSRIGSMLVSDPLFEYAGSRAIVEEMARATVDSPADLRALPVGEELTQLRGVKWPVVTDRSASQGGTARRYNGQDGRTGFPTPSGKAVILPREDPTLRRPAVPDYPLKAVVSVDAGTWWDGQFYRPSGGAVVRPRVLEGAYIEMTREDAASLLLEEGEMAQVTSAQGTVTLPVRFAVEGTAPGHVFMPWGADTRTQMLAPSFPLDSNGVPPWSVFPVRVSPAPLPD